MKYNLNLAKLVSLCLIVFLCFGPLSVFSCLLAQFNTSKKDINKKTAALAAVAASTETMSDNPLLQPFELPYGAIPFDKIEHTHYMPAANAALAAARAQFLAIGEQPEAPSFENTILPLERATEQLDLISGIFFNLNSSRGDENSRAIAKELSVKLSAFENDLLLSAPIFERLSAVVASEELKKRSAVDKELVRNYYDRFVRNGARLHEADKERLRTIDARLATLGQLFAENVLKATDNYELLITRKKDLAGLPNYAVAAAAAEAKERNKKGWLFTLRAPSYRAFIRYADNRSLRHAIYMAYNTRAQSKDIDNRPVLKETAQLRHERAQLLGYTTHAHYVLEKRMARNPETAQGFLHEIQNHALPFAKKEIKDLEAYAKQLDGIDKLQRWDLSYYMEKYKKANLDLDDELLKPYFSVKASLSGIFQVAQQLYGLRFKQRNDLPPYHPDVRIYEVRDHKGKYMALFYVDLFSREGKRNGAWMNFFKDQYYRPDGTDSRPHVTIVCNFSQGLNGAPSLLTFSEVETLFHEFGHALHGMLSDVPYASLSGTNVYWDFVEVPSQLLENWLYEKDCLDLFARHYETNELIDQAYVERLRALKRFMAGYLTIRQLTFGQLDMGWHSGALDGKLEVSAFEKELLSPLELFPAVKGVTISTAFSHIFSGGYSAGYYSYKWAEMIEADAFEYFTANGKVFDTEIAARFRREVLARGGSEPADVLYRSFRGRAPDPKAFMRRVGFISSDK